ncbi:sel1 repeat family protein [Halomonas campisalis]|uniref:Sel1 repeat family protein n=1 Tax=Billgrantia campisalis TaxID=74661 RepID=A0ABS9P8V3_9GAMM|nr:hypothetical protein [Halomonas campisalis]MCG6658202.1 sel1 repeat family protein [Halomonas campisalis]MDR5862870.1 hypothetical protein [Halomonas campisalis]
MKPYLLLLMATLVHGSLSWADEPSVASPQGRMIDSYLAYGQFKMGRYEQAFDIWQRLAMEGNADAAFQLGVMLEDGRGTPPDLERALSYYRQASEGGSRRAAHRLAALYGEGAPGLAVDHALSQHYRKMAESPSSLD